MLLKTEDVAEYFDGLASVRQKAARCAALIQSAKHIIAFTGAGISTSAGIPDYRGSSGIDTKQYLGQADSDDTAAAAADSNSENSDEYYTRLRPTATHRALVQLERRGRLHYVITQNCDDLHRKAGTAATQL